MPEQPADTLRRAAALMRKRAQAAIADGWNEPGVATEAWAPRRKDQRQLIVGCGKDQYDRSDPEAWVPKRYVADAEEESFAEHIAALHPCVALLIADTWDEVANVSAFEERLAGVYSPSAIEAHAVAAARAYLGES